ncbi:hypothetical protein HZ326_14989 [Fusarium oxysporum f. sp. albedinis]|nr:hypothetical protein HZ326_14989 [Fusarium oxysporum f. sp. albedinis]
MRFLCRETTCFSFPESDRRLRSWPLSKPPNTPLSTCSNDTRPSLDTNDYQHSRGGHGHGRGGASRVSSFFDTLGSND